MNVPQIETYYSIKEFPDKYSLSSIYGQDDNFTILNSYLEHNSKMKKTGQK